MEEHEQNKTSSYQIILKIFHFSYEMIFFRGRGEVSFFWYIQLLLFHSLSLQILSTLIFFSLVFIISLCILVITFVFYFFNSIIFFFRLFYCFITALDFWNSINSDILFNFHSLRPLQQQNSARTGRIIGIYTIVVFSLSSNSCFCLANEWHLACVPVIVTVV